jgi:hypothetical protein
MFLDLSSAPLWLRFAIVYLLIGWCTQLPGGLFRTYKRWWAVSRNFELYGSRALLDTPFVWIPFSILLWPIPFLRAGLNRAVLALVAVGIISSVVLIGYVTTVLGAVLVVIVAGLVSVYLVGPRRR